MLRGAKACVVGCIVLVALNVCWWTAPVLAASTLVFPQLVAGSGASSSLVLINPSLETETGVVEFFDPQGKPLELSVGGTFHPTHAYSVPAGGFIMLEVLAEDVLQTGYALVRPSGEGGHLLGMLRIHLGEEEVLLMDGPVRKEKHVYVEWTSSVRTGLAVVNLSQQASILRLEMLEATGGVAMEHTLPLASGEQRVGFIDDFFQDLEQPLRAVLRVGASEVFSLTALRQDSAGRLSAIPGGRDGEPDLPVPGPDLFSGDLALVHVRDQMAWGPRPTGSSQLLASGNEIQSKLTSLGWAVEEDLHTLDLEALRVPVRNLVARRGQGPVVILGAHYDTRIRADRDPDPDRRQEEVPGANDGGSGTAVLLELARVISDHYLPNLEIRLVFFDAEDNGGIDPWTDRSESLLGGWIIGSSLYAGNLDLESEEIQYMILVDMVGDMNQRFPQESFSRSSAPELVDEIWAVAATLGFDDVFVPESGAAILDDHRPFIERGIPAVDIIDLDYPFWHTTEDTLDKVSAQSLERVGRVLQTFLMQRGVITRSGD